MEITKDDFEAYEAVRTNGLVNMFLTGMVSDLSDLPREKVSYIRNNYESLMKLYPDVRKKPSAAFDME